MHCPSLTLICSYFLSHPKRDYHSSVYYLGTENQTPSHNPSTDPEVEFRSVNTVPHDLSSKEY